MKYQLEKSRPPTMRPTTGMMRSLTSESTILPNAAPMITPTARSTTLPLTANSRNSCSSFFMGPPPRCTEARSMRERTGRVESGGNDPLQSPVDPQQREILEDPMGNCTHLGCSPGDKLQPGPQPSLPDDWQGGFLCPCHGSTFDLAGRVFKNKPAPDNLEVPPYVFLTDTRLLIGEDKKA